MTFAVLPAVFAGHDNNRFEQISRTIYVFVILTVKSAANGETASFYLYFVRWQLVRSFFTFFDTAVEP